MTASSESASLGRLAWRITWIGLKLLVAFEFMERGQYFYYQGF